MAGRGVFFAVSSDQERRLLGGGDVVECVEDIEEEWDRDWLVEMDGAWDAIHRCLNVDPLDEWPLRQAVISERQLHDGDDYVVSYLDAAHVAAAASLLDGLDDLDMTDRYYQIDKHGYERPLDADDLGYTLENFRDMKDFFRKAAAAGRAVIFTVDQ